MTLCHILVIMEGLGKYIYIYIYIYIHCTDTGSGMEDQARAMDNRNKWWKRIRGNLLVAHHDDDDIIYIYIYIFCLLNSLFIIIVIKWWNQHKRFNNSSGIEFFKVLQFCFERDIWRLTVNTNAQKNSV